VGVRSDCGGVYVKPHILNRHGVKWPPGFFSGQAGCSCCAPPPPPPPPNFVYYRRYYGYGYGTTGLVPNVCPFCNDTASGGQVANKWQLEVDAPYGVTPPSPCGALSAGTDDICNNAAGTWILTRGYGATDYSFDPISGHTFVETFCVWNSPAFDWYGVYPIPDQFGAVYCWGCSNLKGKYVLTLQRLFDLTANTIIGKLVTLMIDESGGSSFGGNYTRWLPAAGDDQFDCLGVNTMNLDRDAFHIGGDAGPQSPFCCDGIDNTVYLLPLP
jgi:hypothetical protein